MRLAIFDFDGTLTKKDSFIEFLIFTHGGLTATVKSFILLPVIIGYLFKTVPNWKLKEYFLKSFYKGWPLDRFNQAAQRYAAGHLAKLVRDAAYERLRWHKDSGHKVVVVSASPVNYLHPWCEKESLELLATELEIHDNRLTGKISGNNCHGEEKIRRIKETYSLSGFDYIYSYGDSPGDLPLKGISNEFHYKPFRGSGPGQPPAKK